MQGLTRQKIWDPVTRLWHWVLVISVTLAWVFGEFMDFDTILWHFYLGYLVLGLLAFRLLWGSLGPRPIRLRALLPTPAAVLRYLKTVPSREPGGSHGHNPLGALSVIAILLALTAVSITGLFLESEDFFEAAPLAPYVEQATINRMTWWHDLLADVILILVSLHVAAILYYLVWKRENLILPMISGWKWVRRDDH